MEQVELPFIKLPNELSISKEVPMEIQIFFEDWISHPEYWFSKSFKYDNYISLKYQHLLTTTIWNAENDDLNYHLAFIILYDQVPRQIYREKDPDDIIGIYLEKSLSVHTFVTKHFDLAKFNAIEWSFFQLPIRHTKHANKIIGVIHDTWKRLKSENDEDEINQYIQFLKASYNRFPTDQSEYIEESVSKNTNHRFELKDFAEYIDILNNCPFIENSSDCIEETEIYIAIEKFIVKNKVKNLIISLSGGVDSMVCSYVITKLQKICYFQIVAVNIDYCNRAFKE